MFLVTNQVHSYNTRNSNTCYLFPTWTSMTFGIRFHGFNFLNSININIHSASTISLFKSRLKKFLLSWFTTCNNTCVLLLFVRFLSFVLLAYQVRESSRQIDWNKQTDTKDMYWEYILHYSSWVQDILLCSIFDLCIKGKYKYSCV